MAQDHDSDDAAGGGFLRTVPGILGALAAVVTALTGLVIGFNGIGQSADDGRPAAQPVLASSLERTVALTQTADAVAGTWSGSFKQGHGHVFELQLTVAKGCGVGEPCGSIRSSQVPCFGDLSLKGFAGETLEFSVDHFSDSSGTACQRGAGELLTPRGDDALLYTTSYDPTIRGILHPPR